MTKIIKEKFAPWDYLKEHKIWSATIASIVAGGVFSDTVQKLLLVSWGYIRGTTVSVWDWNFSTHAVYGWAILILVFLSLSAITLFIFKAIQTYEVVKKEKEEPDVFTYNQEFFYDINWTWSWQRKFGTETYYPDELNRYCPECQSELKIDHYARVEVECINDNCNWTWKWGNRHGSPKLLEVEAKLRTEISRKARTGEYLNTN